VLRWNENANADVQREIAAAIGPPGKNLWRSLGDLLDELDLPRGLADIGITDQMIAQIVEYALQSPIVAANPRPVRTEADVREILTLAA